MGCARKIDESAVTQEGEALLELLIAERERTGLSLDFLYDFRDGLDLRASRIALGSLSSSSPKNSHSSESL